ncbi:unnamed protein product, partial [Symbiodinium sp. KB8]
NVFRQLRCWSQARQGRPHLLGCRPDPLREDPPPPPAAPHRQPGAASPATSRSGGPPPGVGDDDQVFRAGHLHVWGPWHQLQHLPEDRGAFLRGSGEVAGERPGSDFTQLHGRCAFRKPPGGAGLRWLLGALPGKFLRRAPEQHLHQVPEAP